MRDARTRRAEARTLRSDAGVGGSDAGVGGSDASADWRRVVREGGATTSATGAGGAFSKALAKHVSSCRRLVTFLRWVKYSANFEEAAETTAEPLRGLLYAEATLNVTVDSMQDVVTLEKLGLVRLPRWLSGFEKLAEVLEDTRQNGARAGSERGTRSSRGGRTAGLDRGGVAGGGHRSDASGARGAGARPRGEGAADARRRSGRGNSATHRRGRRRVRERRRHGPRRVRM